MADAHTQCLEGKKVLLMHALGARAFHNYPDLGLGYLAASLIKRGVKQDDLRIVCKELARLTPDAFRRLLSEERFDVVGVKTFSGTVNEANATLAIVKQELPDALRVIGGPHPSSVMAKVFEDMPDASFAFRGECEEVFPEFLDACFAGDQQRYAAIDGLMWRDNGEARVNDLPVIKDLDSIGLPCWDLLGPRDTRINPFNGIAMRSPMAPIMMSRGCNFRCTFCATHLLNGYGIRYRSIPRVLDELEMLAGKYGIREFQIVDANAAASRERFAEFCQGLLDRKLDFTWSCPHGIRLEGVDEELVGLMRRSGCYCVYVGVESGSPRILKKVRKGTNLDRLKERIGMVSRAGIKVFGFFMIGFPGETREDVEMTVAYARELDIMGGSFAVYTPFPGTELYDEALATGRLGEGDLVRMDTMNYENKLSELSSEELFKIRRKMFFQLYCRPRTLFYFLSAMKSPYNLYYQLRAVCRQYFGFLK